MTLRKHDRINANTVRKDSVDGKLYLRPHSGSGVIYQKVATEPTKSSAKGEEVCICKNTCLFCC